MNLERIQQRIGYRFKQSELLVQALTHRGYGAPHNERLEFLGDSVLGCVVSEELFRRFPRLEEGQLTRLKASLVRKDSLHQVAQSMGMGEWLRLGEAELKSGGFTRPSILADATEALFGAVFLDGGFDAAKQVVLHVYRDLIETLDLGKSERDAKTALQELLQSRHKILPKYALRGTTGADHAQTFEVECTVPDLSLSVTGSGASRRAGEQAAAQAMLELLKEKGTPRGKKRAG